MIVDIHTHRWESPEQLGQAGAERIRRFGAGPWDRLDAGRDAHLKAIDPVDYAVVHGFVSKHLGASITADLVADYVKQAPEKLLGFAGIDPMAEDYLDEFDKAVELGLVGVTISPAAQGFHPTHTRATRLYERCQDRGMPVLIHPDTHLGSRTKLEFAQPYQFDEVARDFPDLPLIFAQIGHPWADQTLNLIGKHPRVYADLSDLVCRPWQLYNVLLLAYQQDVCGHLLLGSDFPFSTAEQAIVTIYSVNTLTHGTNLPTVPREQLRSIVERDALECLGLKRPGDPADTPPRKQTDEMTVPSGETAESTESSSHETQGRDADASDHEEAEKKAKSRGRRSLFKKKARRSPQSADEPRTDESTAAAKIEDKEDTPSKAETKSESASDAGAETAESEPAGDDRKNEPDREDEDRSENAA